MTNVCVVTGTRAEYGLLKGLIKRIDESEDLSLLLIATGTHLEKSFGYTLKEITDDGFNPVLIDMDLKDDSPVGIAESSSLGLVLFTKFFSDNPIDLLLVLGDRFEIMTAVLAGVFARIPIAHLHGGEITEGLVDDVIRHSITKCSHLHFVANEQYRRRVIQMGENPQRVFNVGGLGVDAIENVCISNREQLEKALDLQFSERNFLVTFHPVTLEVNSAKVQILELISALESYLNTTVIFTMPNADMEGMEIYNEIDKAVRVNKNFYLFKSLGQKNYFSMLNEVDLLIGNSSSGLSEAPTFKIPTVNIGNRQAGRMKAKSVIDCHPNRQSIREAIEKAISTEFQSILTEVENPYGSGGASQKIVDTIVGMDLSKLLVKSFNDF